MDRGKTIVSSLLKWHKENRRTFPWREDRNPYRVLVAEFFLQRTPANRVAVFFPKFVKEFSSPEELARANPVNLEETYRSLGLKKRISWLVKSMRVVCDRFGGKIPDEFETLTSLPGVGEYTASAVLCFGFGRPVPIVDANIVRVLTRIFGLPDVHRTGSVTIKKIALKLLPTDRVVAYNEALLDLAALICKKRPLCNCCPLNYLCAYCIGTERI